LIQPKIIYLVNPNNPTGTFTSIDDLKKLTLNNPNVLFIIDEAYYEFVGKSIAVFATKVPNIIVTRTFSKAFSLASIRFGYICADDKLLKQINKIRNTKEVNSFAQKLAEVALDNNNYIQERINLITKPFKVLDKQLVSKQRKIKGSKTFEFFNIIRPSMNAY
jgi:histidinol-phosphate aminotransferase